MNGLLPFLYLSLRSVCPQNPIRNFEGHPISGKGHRQIYTGKIKLSAFGPWGLQDTATNYFHIIGTATRCLLNITDIHPADRMLLPLQSLSC
jgi:hypothetical protein